MIISVLFVVLAVLAVASAGGLLFFRRVDRCVLSFLLCATALAGLYLLLNLQFMAAIQLTMGVGLLGSLLVTSLPISREQPGSTPQRVVDDTPGSGPLDRLRWVVVAAVAFAAAVYWGIARGTIGEPVPTSPPVWAVPGEHIPALGKEITTSYLIPFALLGLLLLACVVSAAYQFRQGKETDA
jgi:NADH-quinone oxidoreductase subunit J